MYTRGEWRVDQNKFGDYLIISTDRLKHSAIAEIPKNNDNAEANAQLISACPDLYEAIDLALNDLSERGRITSTTEVILWAAKAKADGK